MMNGSIRSWHRSAKSKLRLDLRDRGLFNAAGSPRWHIPPEGGRGALPSYARHAAGRGFSQAASPGGQWAEKIMAQVGKIKAAT